MFAANRTALPPLWGHFPEARNMSNHAFHWWVPFPRPNTENNSLVPLNALINRRYCYVSWCMTSLSFPRQSAKVCPCSCFAHHCPEPHDNDIFWWEDSWYCCVGQPLSFNAKCDLSRRALMTGWNAPMYKMQERKNKKCCSKKLWWPKMRPRFWVM